MSFFFLAFLQNVYQSALVPQNLPCPEKFLFASDIILFAKDSILKVWQCSEDISIYEDNCSVICAVTLCYISHRLHQIHSELCLLRYMQSYWGICSHMQAYAALLRHIHTYWSIIKTYSGIFSTLCMPHISTILRSLGIYLEPQANSKPCETVTWQIRNCVIVGIFFTFYI